MSERLRLPIVEAATVLDVPVWWLERLPVAGRAEQDAAKKQQAQSAAQADVARLHSR